MKFKSHIIKLACLAAALPAVSFSAYTHYTGYVSQIHMNTDVSNVDGHVRGLCFTVFRPQSIDTTKYICQWYALDSKGGLSAKSVLEQSTLKSIILSAYASGDKVALFTGEDRGGFESLSRISAYSNE